MPDRRRLRGGIRLDIAVTDLHIALVGATAIEIV